MGLGTDHGVQHNKPARLERTTNSEELEALCVGLMVLVFVLCYVMWARPKKYIIGQFQISNG
jgi:hypothetical protein